MTLSGFVDPGPQMATYAAHINIPYCPLHLVNKTQGHATPIHESEALTVHGHIDLLLHPGLRQQHGPQISPVASQTIVVLKGGPVLKMNTSSPQTSIVV